ncbi:MAG: GspE/PulE family protein [Gammaproteobacteria bacterium]|nr:GspE/PulE family protein [Gammaproteobacteria bacterium]
MVIARLKTPLGELLQQKGLITGEQLDAALLQQAESGEQVGQILVRLAFIDEDEMLKTLAEQLQLAFVDLSSFDFDSNVVLSLRETFARRYGAIVLEDRGVDFLVGMNDPMDIFASDEIERILQRPIEPAVVRPSELNNTLDLAYRRTEEIASFAEELDGELIDGQFDLAAIAVGADDSDAPVVKLLQSMFEDAVQVRASDIHIEPDENVLRIRQRIDGVLQEQVMKEKRIASALVLRLKLLSGLNISEKRLPQDGRFSVLVKGRRLDVRLSTMPIAYGESVVMRLLDQTEGVTDLNQVGMPADMLARFRRLMQMPHGLILVTGPTGSGKTTTLYGALQELNVVDKKIISVEDPVEYKLHRINQVQVNEKIHLDFARVLRSALRQDPDILMVGEIRDRETADIALRAAMTGHLVLSTLHTNDALASAMRLVDMGVEGFLAATALRALVAQRLVRRLCDTCKKEHDLEDGDRLWVQSLLGAAEKPSAFYQAVGCHRCNMTGYRGRVGVFEMLVMNQELGDALRRGDSSEFIRVAQRTPGYVPLVKSALDFALAGITSLEEVLRVSEQVDDSIDFVSEH